MKIPRPRLSYANVAATLALVIAASMGGAYAHGKIGSALIKDNAVKSRHIGPGQVKTPDLAGGAVTTAKIRAKAVTRNKLAANAQTQVIEYRLGAHNFATQAQACFELPGVSRSQVHNSVWTAQLDDTFAAGDPTPDDITYAVPGGGEFGTSQYRIFVQASDTSTAACVTRQSGTGESYDRLRIIRTIATTRLAGTALPRSSG